MSRRVWRYRYGSWATPWYHYLVPQSGTVDEYGYKTVVVHVPFVGFLVWAYRICHCEDCEMLRAEGYWKEELNDAAT
jgi:hypothetical protein